MNTHTLMFILLVAMLTLRGCFFVTGKFGKPVVSKVATRHSAVVAHADSITPVALDPIPTDIISPLWRDTYGCDDDDWA